MKLTADGKYNLSPDCANDSETGATVAAWDAQTKEPHPDYPGSEVFIEQYDAEIPELEPVVPEPNWDNFRVAMLSNPGYQRITLLSAATPAGNLAVQRTENAISMPVPSLELVQVLWEQILAQIPLLNRPTSTELAQWNAIASASHMTFAFRSDGRMQLR